MDSLHVGMNHCGQQLWHHNTVTTADVLSNAANAAVHVPFFLLLFLLPAELSSMPLLQNCLLQDGPGLHTRAR